MPVPEVIKHFSCSTQLSIKFSLLIRMKMPTKVCIFIFITRDFLCTVIISKKEFAIVVISDLPSMLSEIGLLYYLHPVVAALRNSAMLIISNCGILKQDYFNP